MFTEKCVSVQRILKPKKQLDYSMFHVTWATFKFNRNQLGTVSAYVMANCPPYVHT